VVADATDGSEEFLDLLSDDDRRELEARAGRRRFKPGASLTHEGSRGAEVLILLSGRAKISIDTEDGREVVLGFCGPGRLIGEFSVIDREARSGTTEALEPIEALALAGEDFLALLEQRPGISLALLRDLVRRFRDVDRLRIEFASAQTLGRVAARLNELADQHGEEVEDGIAITLPISQDELAGWAGCSRESTAKALQKLRELGAIRTERRRIVVMDEAELRRQSA
jgi:CRP/FNR family transcriptional regulator, cyclic AMP receptor protein